MKKIQLSTVVAISNIISSLVLIVSIFILIGEYRQSKVLNDKDLEDRVYDRMMELDRLVIENADLGEIITKAIMSGDSLSEAAKIRYLAYEHIFYDSWETLWVGYENGVVRKETWDDWNDWFKREFTEKPRISWEGNLEQFSPSFLDFLQEEIKAINLFESK